MSAEGKSHLERSATKCKKVKGVRRPREDLSGGVGGTLGSYGCSLHILQVLVWTQNFSLSPPASLSLKVPSTSP